jgi:hypothetical protein
MKINDLQSPYSELLFSRDSSHALALFDEKNGEVVVATFIVLFSEKRRRHRARKARPLSS